MLFLRWNDIRSGRLSLPVLACALLLGAASAAGARTAESPEAGTTAADESCILCAGDFSVPVVPLRAAWLDSLAVSHARFNLGLLEHLNSLYEAGTFGSPKQSEARRHVHLLARLNTINAYRDLVMLACDSTRVVEADEAILRQLNVDYSDMLLFSTAQLRRVRMGLGRVCMQYDVTGRQEGKSVHGGKRLRWRVKDVEIDGQERRLLSIDLPTGTDDVVEALLAPHHAFRVEYSRQPGPPAPFEWFVVYDIQGGWLRKSGTHQPTAYMFWVSPPQPVGERGGIPLYEVPATNGDAPTSHSGEPLTYAGVSLEMPATPLVGVRIYIPGLRLRLPLFLPDFNFDDLREIELPLPILEIDYLKNGKRPSWLGRDDNLGFKDWKGYGPVPPALRVRFPDF